MVAFWGQLQRSVAFICHCHCHVFLFPVVPGSWPSPMNEFRKVQIKALPATASRLADLPSCHTLLDESATVGKCVQLMLNSKVPVLFDLLFFFFFRFESAGFISGP